MPSRIKSLPIYYGHIIVTAAFIIFAATDIATFSYGIFFKPLAEEFGWTRSVTSGPYSLSLLLFGFSSIFAGTFTDRFGPRLVVTICSLFLGFGLMLMSQIGSLWQLYLSFGLIIAIGRSGGSVPPVSAVAQWFTNNRGLATGITTAAGGMSMLLTAPFATQLLVKYGWRTAYLILGSLALLLTLLPAQLLRPGPGNTVNGLRCNIHKRSEFFKIKEKQVFLLKHTFSNSQFWLIGIIYFIIKFVAISVMVHLVPHITDMGFSPVSAANVMAVCGLINILARVGVGFAADKIGVKLSLIIILSLLSLSLIWLGISEKLWAFHFFALVFGLSWGGGIGNTIFSRC